MTIDLFIYLFTIGSVASSLFTQALKKGNYEIPNNILALFSAVVVGLFGTCFAYVLMGIDFTAQNLVCVVLMLVCIWVGSMIGYDKVIQMIAQIKRG